MYGYVMTGTMDSCRDPICTRWRPIGSVTRHSLSDVPGTLRGAPRWNMSKPPRRGSSQFHQPGHLSPHDWLRAGKHRGQTLWSYLTHYGAMTGIIEHSRDLIEARWLPLTP